MGEDRVNQCTAVTELHVDGALMILRAGAGESGLPQWSCAFALCELAEKHGEVHAMLVGVCMDSDDEGLWMLWTDERKWFAWHPWCNAESDSGEGCVMYASHPGADSWKVSDPTMAAWLAIRREEG